MTVWEKIKCIFGFCPLDITKDQEQAIMETYKTEPKVMKVKEAPKAKTKVVAVKKAPVKKVTSKVESKIEDIATEVKVENAKAVKKAKEVKKAKVSEDKTPSAPKAKRSWYNNKKTQKLVTSEEITELPKTWIKGRLPKGAK